MLVFDYLCNAQTKFFLSLMAASPNFSRFIAIGYADLASTACLAIIGLSVAYASFLFSAYQLPIADVRIDLEFPTPNTIKSQKQPSNVDKAGLVTAKIIPSEIDRMLNGFEDTVVNAHKPAAGTSGYLVRYIDGVRTTQFKNERDVIEHFISERSLSLDSKKYEPSKNAGDYDACHEFANAINQPHFHFEVTRGWDTQQIAQNCRSATPTELHLTLRIKDDDFRYTYAATGFAGDLITLSLRSLVNGFRTYTSDSFTRPILFTENWSWNYWVGDNKQYTLFTNRLFATAWSYTNGGFRVLQTNGFPWSTFYVASIMTSWFIWIVLIFTAFLFPIVWIFERLATHTAMVRIRDHPFSSLALVTVVMFSILTFMFRWL